MRMYDIITKKKRGGELTEEEIRFFIDGFTRGEIPDYQVSSLLMAVCFVGMSDKETYIMTDAMMHSGDTLDLSRFGELSVDKHSTGGVGDKTTLVVAPLVASLGAKVAKMSGRGLGHTGGTVDKLESFPGYRTELSPEEFMTQVEEVGIAVIGQSGELAPADKKLYALRDVTATVDSIPLITGSIMSKKLAAGSKSIVLDVKYGSGGFMKTPEDAEMLARKMVRIGRSLGRRVSALITSMDAPLGFGIGNAIEVREALEVLHGRGPADLREVCLSLASTMLHLSLGLPIEKARALAENALDTGLALHKFEEWITRQGATTLTLPEAKYQKTVFMPKSGYLNAIDTEVVGNLSVSLGGGRRQKSDKIDHTAGIILSVSLGDYIEEGAPVATLYTTEHPEAMESVATSILATLTLGEEKREDLPPLIYKVILGGDE